MKGNSSKRALLLESIVFVFHLIRKGPFEIISLTAD